MYTIDKVLSKHICRTCGNLSYWDGYFCKIGRHKTKKHNLSMRPLKTCEEYKKRQGHNYESCEGQECVFWCRECPAYINKPLL